MQVAQVFKNSTDLLDTTVVVNGWVKTCRKQSGLVFIELNDGTTQKGLQIVAAEYKVDNFNGLSCITTGTSIQATGTLTKSPAKGQLVEMSATNIKIYQICPGDFPMQKVGLPLEFLRENLHLRHRTNRLRAVFKVKSIIEKAIHDFFTERNYTLVDLPILTTNACEGGCQPLLVTSLLNEGTVSSIPRKTNHQVAEEFMRECNKTGDGFFGGMAYSDTIKEPIVSTNKIDFSKDFFDNPVYLTVSNQLHLECFAHGMGPVYTFTPATRGEPSQSTKHLATFSMLEAEFCFGELSNNIDISESCIKFCIKKALECEDEMAMLDKACGGKLLPKLQLLASEPFERISHRNAIGLLRETHCHAPFQEEPLYAGDLTGEHERWLVAHFGKPVVVMYYPKKVKAFYMPVHHSEEIDGVKIEYVDCYDLLMDIGEVVGGSQRIWSESELISRMTELEIDPAHLSWYVDLRRYGSAPHGGFGLGLERLVAVITGMDNVKDCTSFPITIHHCKF